MPQILEVVKKVLWQFPVHCISHVFLMFLSTLFAFYRSVFLLYFQKPDWICSVSQDMIVLVECLENFNTGSNISEFLWRDLHLMM